MGFLDSALQVIGGILGAPAGPVGVAAGAGAGASLANLFGVGGTDPNAAAVAGLVAGPIVGPLVAGAATQRRMKNIVITRIQTIDPAGNMVKEEIKRGAPFLMARDFMIAKKVFKATARAAARIPRRTVKQSKAAQIEEAIKQQVLAQVTNGHPNGGPIQLTAPLTAG